MGTDTVSDVPIRNVQRETFNSQLSTGWPKGRMVVGTWGQTRNLKARTLALVDPTKRPSDGRGGLGAQIWGQTRCPIYRSGTFNVKRSTLNFQRGGRKGECWVGYGDRHGIWRTELFDPVDLTRRRSDGPGRLGAQIWGQTRCPTYRSGTFNVKRSTLNF